VLSYLISNIIKRSSTKVVQSMPLGFSIIASTVTFDLFLRWATQGPLGPLVLYNTTHKLSIIINSLHFNTKCQCFSFLDTGYQVKIYTFIHSVSVVLGCWTRWTTTPYCVWTSSGATSVCNISTTSRTPVRLDLKICVFLVTTWTILDFFKAF